MRRIILIWSMLIAANSALAELEGPSPWVLRAALDTIAAAADGSLPATNDAVPKSILDPSDGETLARNPALNDVWRTAPEAAVDLLALIRAAGGKGNRPK